MKNWVSNLYNKSWPLQLYSKARFILGYQATPQLSDYLGTGGNGFTSFIFISILYLWKSLWSSKKLFRHILHPYWLERDGFNKTWQKWEFILKVETWIHPQTITHATHSADHVMDIVILTCGTLLFFHHL